MFIWGPQIDQCIIYEHCYKLIHIWFEDPIHEIHKCRWDICKPKRHHYKFIMSISSVECSLRYVLFHDSELVIPQTKVCLGEGPRTSKLVKKIIYPRQRVTILGHCFV